MLIPGQTESTKAGLHQRPAIFFAEDFSYNKINGRDPSTLLRMTNKISQESPMVKGSDLKVDKEKCISCGTCIASYETLFKFGKDGKSVPIKTGICKECEINKVINVCPQGAIKKAGAKKK